MTSDFAKGMTVVAIGHGAALPFLFSAWIIPIELLLIAVAFLLHHFLNRPDRLSKRESELSVAEFTQEPTVAYSEFPYVRVTDERGIEGSPDGKIWFPIDHKMGR